jgi:hypothetical protein
MNVDEVLQNFNGKDGLAWGVDTAIKALRPGCKFDVAVSGGQYNFTRWWDPSGKPAPTSEEINKEYEFQQKLSEYVQYSYDRCKEYPDGFEQLDMLWHAVNEGIDLKDSEWFQRIKEVKEKCPKPEGEIPTRD